MHPILAQLGPVTLYAWGLFVAIGFLVVLAISVRLGRSMKLSPDLFVDLVVVLIIASLIGARTFYVIQTWSEFSSRPWEILMLQQGGLVFYGGLITGFLAFAWFAKRRGISLLRLADAVAPGSALGYAIGRIGCFLNGCCFGIETTVPWAVTFPNFPGLRHPTQLYSTGAGLVLFVILLVIWRRRKAEGQVIYSALIGYGIYRFILEFFRYSDIHLFGLTPSHYISLVLIIIGCLGLRKIKVV